MTEESVSLRRQSANLFFLGRAPIACDITHVKNNGLIVQLAEQAECDSGNHVDVHLVNHEAGQSSGLKLRCIIKNQINRQCSLSFVDNTDAAVRQLLNWFAQPLPSGRASASPQAIIAEIELVTIKQFHIFLENYLLEVDRRLMSMAEWATSNDQKNKIFDIKSQLLAKQNSVKDISVESMKLQMAKSLQQPNDNNMLQATDPEKWALVDLDTFEDWLSLEGIIRRSEQKNQQSLLCLSKRYSLLTGRSVALEDVPVSAQNFCRALQAGFKQSMLPIDFLSVVYKIYEQTVIEQLDTFYDSVNARLKACGVLPDVEAQLSRDRRVNKSEQYCADVVSSATPDIDISSQDVATQEPATANIMPGRSQQQLFNTVADILNITRQSTGHNIANESGDNPQTLAKKLTRLQQQVLTMQEHPSLLTWLEKNNSIVIDRAAEDTLRLVDAVFKDLGRTVSLPRSTLQVLNKLQPAIARAALLDAGFFSSEQNPVRDFLNLIMQLCENSDMPNASLEKKFSSLVGDINTHFQVDTAIFDDALKSLATLSAQQANAYSRNVERVAQTYEGRQLISKAQQAVEREIKRRIGPPSAPAIAIELLENGWRELLKITYIKQGSDSAAWREHLQTLDQLLFWINARQNTEVDTLHRVSAEQQLEADTFADLIDQYLNDLYPGDYKHRKTIETIRLILKGKIAIEVVELADNDDYKTHNPNQIIKELQAAHPDLSRWFKRTKSLREGEEFAYLNDEAGRRNIKLVWISEDRQHFVFVNNRGQKVLDFDVVDLAKELSKGLQPVAKQSEWKLVERSLYSTVQDAYQQLAHKSSHDELTNLCNRKECEKILHNMLQDAKNKWQNHCLLYLDIDKFSLTNNLYGHVAGDDLLKSFSEYLLKELTTDAVVSRMAGNEFAILLKQTNTHEGHVIAESIRNAIDGYHFSWEEHNIPLTVSIGVVAINKYTANVVDLIRDVTTACQQAKEAGGNRCYDFRQGSEVQNHRDKLLSWIDQLNNTLTRDRLILRGQPIKSVDNNGPCSHYEILLAIKNDAGELESPVDFIEAAECYNRMQKVDRWIIDSVFEWLSSLSQSGYETPDISINLSGNSINDEHFIDFLLAEFAKHRIPTGKICFEITETATINNISAAAEFIREIKKIGCKSSLDDYGSGNASYQYLKHLPVDYIKIDGAFIKNITSSVDDYAMVRSINEIAHLMGKKTIAEYTETDEIIAVLQGVGVDYIQGYAISRPILLEDIPLIRAVNY